MVNFFSRKTTNFKTRFTNDNSIPKTASNNLQHQQPKFVPKFKYFKFGTAVHTKK